MTLQKEHSGSQSPLMEAIVANTLRPHNYELVRQLGQVLGIKAEDHVLLIAEGTLEAQRLLEHEIGCTVVAHQGDLHNLPYATEQFDSAIVAVPVTREVHAIARELSRVLKSTGTLGMVVLSVYRDQMPDDATLFNAVLPLIASTRPAAAYRAVLAECGFTAFVSRDRRRDVQRTARAAYSQHLLPSASEPMLDQPVASQAIELIATGGVGVTIITAEKGL